MDRGWIGGGIAAKIGYLVESLPPLETEKGGGDAQWACRMPAKRGPEGRGAGCTEYRQRKL